MCEICENWARDGRDSLKIGGQLLAPNHHPSCPHYDDSLIDVWKVTIDGVSLYMDNEQTAKDAAGNATITKERMHREIFDSLPDFEGF